jgi:hypothetical protein
MANTHEHLEHAEHAAHHAPDGFAQKVAVSMAIIAAVLAGLSMVGHRTHNKVLMLGGEANRLQGEANRLLGEINRLQAEANRLRTEASTAEVEKSNLFAWYQSKRLRQSQFQISIAMLRALQPHDEEARKKALADWQKKADEYNDPNDPDSLPNILKKGNAAGEKSKELQVKADAVMGKTAKVNDDAAKATEKSNKAKEEADHVHHQADRLDIAHLLAEIGLVICSVAVLTRKKAFWYAGILAAVFALGVGASAYMIPHDHHEPAASQGDKH